MSEVLARVCRGAGALAETGGQRSTPTTFLTWPPVLPGSARPSSCFRSSSSWFRESSMPAGRAGGGGGGDGQPTKSAAGERAATFGWRPPRPPWTAPEPPCDRPVLRSAVGEVRRAGRRPLQAATHWKTSAAGRHRRWPFLKGQEGCVKRDQGRGGGATGASEKESGGAGPGEIRSAAP